MAIHETTGSRQLTILTAIPAAGNPETVVAAASLFKKAYGYNTVEFIVTGTAGGPEDYQVLRWWPVDQTWRPEGPRGATPATVELTGANSVPVRVSVPVADCYLAIMRTTADPGITGEKALIEAQTR